MSRKEFFSLYDYGQGGLWVIIRADSVAQICKKYPQLEVFEGVPPMLDDATVAIIRRTGVQDIDEPPAGWLADLGVAAGVGGSEYR